MKNSILNFYYIILSFVLFVDSTKVFAEFQVIDVDEEIHFNEIWYKKKRYDEDNFKHLINGLKNTPSGKIIIDKATEKAAQKGLTLYDVIAVGDGSLTDTTLVRRFAASDPANVIYETKSIVYLNRHLEILDAILDLAHELTHFTYREAFNPYDHRFTLKDFIKGTVEGRGGEVDAYIVECKVLFELLPGQGSNRTNCLKIFDKKLGSISKELGIIEFYKIGAHYKDFKKDLKNFSLEEKDLPDASNAEALFISSAWGLPYPVAAIKEFTNIMDRVCKNDQNRLSMMQNKITRSPASNESANFESQSDHVAYKTMFEDYKIRCEKFETH